MRELLPRWAPTPRHSCPQLCETFSSYSFDGFFHFPALSLDCYQMIDSKVTILIFSYFPSLHTHVCILKKAIFKTYSNIKQEKMGCC